MSSRGVCDPYPKEAVKRLVSAWERTKWDSDDEETAIVSGKYTKTFTCDHGIWKKQCK